jgi:hypothetical protein
LTPFIGLVDQRSVQDLLRCAKHLFVAAMVAWVHGSERRLPAIMFLKCSGAARAKRRRHQPAGALCPLF